jgi:hypothetical protein
MRTVKRRSQIQEKKTAQEVGGEVIPASGALWFAPADARNKKYLFECKTTEEDFYTLKYVTWKKIEDEALKDGIRIPVMRVDINESLVGTTSLAVIDPEYFPESLCPKNLGKLNKSTRSIRIKEPMRILFSRAISELVVIPWGNLLKIMEEF